MGSGQMTEIDENVARAICRACEENPDSVGDARGNDWRWQDYVPVAQAAIKAMRVVAMAEKAIQERNRYRNELRRLKREWDVYLNRYARSLGIKNPTGAPSHRSADKIKAKVAEIIAERDALLKRIRDASASSPIASTALLGEEVNDG